MEILNEISPWEGSRCSDLPIWAWGGQIHFGPIGIELATTGGWLWWEVPSSILVKARQLQASPSPSEEWVGSETDGEGQDFCPQVVWFEGLKPKFKTAIILTRSNLVCSLLLSMVFAFKFAPWKVTAICWPEKIDGATAINAMQQLEDTVGKWTQSLQLRTPAACIISVPLWGACFIFECSLQKKDSTKFKITSFWNDLISLLPAFVRRTSLWPTLLLRRLWNQSWHHASWTWWGIVLPPTPPTAVQCSCPQRLCGKAPFSRRSMVYFVLLQVQDALWTVAFNCCLMPRTNVFLDKTFVFWSFSQNESLKFLLSTACFPRLQDARDQRPMAYSGKFIGPLVTSLDTQKVEWLWKDPAINRLRRTLWEARQLNSKQLISMEDLSPTSLPAQVCAPHSANKYSQIGGDAAEQLLMSALDTWCWFNLAIKTFWWCSQILLSKHFDDVLHPVDHFA